jgi:predicted component of type VI protein secretion system
MTAPAIHCANCQHRIPEGASYCPNCGHPVRNSQPASGEPPTFQTASPSLSATRWQLAIVHGTGEQKNYVLDAATTIGRDPACEIHIPDNQISRRHAIIERTSGGYFIRDLGSTNGTFVNRQRIEDPVPLRFGDAITIGDHRLLILRNTLNCGNCGQPVSSGDKFCKICGEPLSGVPAGAEQPAAAQPDTPAPLGETDPQKAAPPTEDPVLPPAPAPRDTFVEASHPAQFATGMPALPPAPPPILPDNSPYTAPPQVSLPPPDQPARRSGIWRTCAILAAVSLCGLAALGLLGYWVYSSGLFGG